jgi:hypothetical protein
MGTLSGTLRTPQTEILSTMFREIFRSSAPKSGTVTTIELISSVPALFQVDDKPDFPETWMQAVARKPAATFSRVA